MTDLSKEIFGLLSGDVDQMSEDELRRLVKHLQSKMAGTYLYWVGHWNDANRAVSTRDGRFVANQEVIDFLSKQD
ncbi:MAG TPA: hypothetical protein GXX72_01290 [Clostridiaceae bacterium]|nr:hypothetical protein [Clostridiaceae bacterium]